jgi:hypothetical protein
MIKHQQEVYSWKFLFLGANQDAIATASAMGIQKGYSANYSETIDSISATSRANSRILRSLKVRAMPDDYEQMVREEEALLVKKPTLRPKA